MAVRVQTLFLGLVEVHDLSSYVLRGVTYDVRSAQSCSDGYFVMTRRPTGDHLEEMDLV